MSPIRSVKGLVALITGAASGLGRGTAERLARKGAKVAVCDLPTSKGQQFVNLLGNDSIFVPADVTSEDDIKKALKQIQDQFGRLDAVVNCAGVSCAFSLFNFNTGKSHKLEDFERIQEVNVTGTFNVVRLAAGLMGQNSPDSDGQRGVVVNVAGFAAFDGQRGQTAFSSSKGGVVGMTLPLARDLASQGIRVCCVAPGLFDTPLTRCVSDEVINYFEEAIPFPKRLGKPDEFAHLVEFVIENPVINGEVVRIDAALKIHPPV